MNPASGRLPGQDLVDEGLADLAQARLTDCALLVLIAAPRLERLGIRVPRRPFPRPYEHCLYGRLDERLGAAAHSYYNSLIRRVVSYARAREREQSAGLSATTSARRLPRPPPRRPAARGASAARLPPRAPAESPRSASRR